MHGQDLGGFHLQEILQHLIRKIRCRNAEVAHRAMQPSHLEGSAARKSKCRRGDEVLYRKPAFRQPAPLKIEAVRVSQMKHVMHKLQAVLAV